MSDEIQYRGRFLGQEMVQEMVRQHIAVRDRHIGDLYVQTDELKARIAALEAERDQLRSDLHDLTDAYGELQQDYSGALEEMQELRRSRDEYKRIAEQAAQEIEKIQKKLEQMNKHG